MVYNVAIKMDTTDRSDLEAFQSEVYKDFNNLKISINVSNFAIDDLKVLADPEFQESSAGTKFFIKIFLLPLCFWGRNIKKTLIDNEDYIQKRQRAENIAQNSKIKEILCPALRKEILSSSIQEQLVARVVRVVTLSLTDPEIAAKLSIEKDVRLFSLIIHNIFQTGIERYRKRATKR